MQETREARVQSLGGEDALEEEMTTSSRSEEPGGLQCIASQRVADD